MSNTFSLICRETKSTLWIGQGNGVMTTFYTGNAEIMERLHRFLCAHMGKQLEVVNDDSIAEEDGWTEFEETE